MNATSGEGISDVVGNMGARHRVLVKVVARKLSAPPGEGGRSLVVFVGLRTGSNKIGYRSSFSIGTETDTEKGDFL